MSCDDITEKQKRDLGFTCSFISCEPDANSDTQPSNSHGAKIANSNASSDSDEWKADYSDKTG